MNTKLKFCLCISLVLILFYFSLPYFNGTNRYFNYLNYIFWSNRLDVSCSKNLNENNIVIIFENEIALTQHRDKAQAKRLLQIKYPPKLMRDTIFKNGKQVMDIPYDYGKQRLAIYYDNNFIGELGHWQTNHYHVHDYSIRLRRHKGIVSLGGKISGPDVSNPIQTSK